MKWFLISYVLAYGGEVREVSRIEFPTFSTCERVKDQLVGKGQGTYAFECRVRAE